MKKIPSQLQRKIKVIKYRGNLNYFISEYMQMESTIVTRFHAMILSLIANQYMYPIIYSDKMLHVLNDLNYTGNYSCIDSIDTSDKILESLKNNNFVLPDTIKNSAESQFKGLDHYILK
jgi:colanic acid/amylovoran biosynthesis protein